jgi:DNA-binding Lrp family transcriptional regulator
MDDVDLKIIAQLQGDGRTTLQTLGKITGYTSMGAKKRLENLVKSGAIKISAQLNLKQLNFYAAIVMIETDGPETTRRLLKRFESCPRVVHIFTTIGGYNMIALVVAEDQKTLESISMEKCSLRSDKGIRRSEFYPIRDVHYSPYMPIREKFAHRNLSSPPCKVDCKTCLRYEDEECVRCPATEYYRGSL